MENRNEASISINLREGEINIKGTETFVEKNMNEIFEFVKEFRGDRQIFDSDFKRQSDYEEEINDNKVQVEWTSTADKYVNGGVYHIDPEDGSISILKNIPGAKKSEKMKNIALIVLHIRKEKIQGKEIIPLCEKHNCYDVSNFSAVFKNEKTNIIRKGSGQSWTIELTQPGETAAIELLEGMLNGKK